MSAVTPTLNYLPLPGRLRGSSGYNARSYNQDSVTTDSQGNLYAVWVAQGGRIIIGKRSARFGTWSTIDTSTIPNAPMGNFVNEDSHNTISIIADAQDRIHVCGNMHGEALKYMISTNPRDITTWTQVTAMVGGATEAQVTYLRFMLHPDGELFIHYREGASGAGDTYLNKYVGSVGAIGAFTRVLKLSDGKTYSENAYENRTVIDRAGTIHIVYTWRQSSAPSFNANNDLYYLRSTDKGATWKTVAGATITMPLLHSDVTARILDTPDLDSGIINQAGLDVDTLGRPHIAISLADGSTPDRNVHHLWWNGTTWVNEQVSDLRNGMGWYARPMRAAIVCTDDGRVLVFYSSMIISPGTAGVIPAKTAGSFRMVDVTDGQLADAPIALLDGRKAEMTIDQRALRERGLIRMLLTACNGELTQTTADKNALEYWHDDNWAAQWGGILTIDALQVGALSRRETPLPRIRTIAQTSVSEDLVVSATTLGIVAGVQPIVTPQEMRGKQLFVRITGRGKVSAAGTTLTLQYRADQQNSLGGTNGSGENGASLPFTGTSTALRSTPWIPFGIGPITGADMLVRLFAAAVGGGTGTISGAVLEVGVLDGPISY
ncbi:BNR repeat-containing protein [Rhodococcus sp. B10]|uniref:BNR repeat-containing protein n=1 Tax=Rhodococcus sp. B10 TaxID=2695876 RepID=UPI001430A2C5|nr:BNR repeat-containing protein [Rhodococcus sp. B10]NIL74844.1 hypothetical protein [Rhodococcus sp. B10]